MKTNGSKKTKVGVRELKQVWLVPPGKTSFLYSGTCCNQVIFTITPSPSPRTPAQWQEATYHWIEKTAAGSENTEEMIRRWLKEVLVRGMVRELGPVIDFSKLDIEVELKNRDSIDYLKNLLKG